MKYSISALQEQNQELDTQFCCADQIVRALRDKSICRFKAGKVTVFLAYPKNAHGGVVLVESKNDGHIDRRYGYLEGLHACFREYVIRGSRDDAPVYEALSEALPCRSKLYEAERAA
ncbi:MAG: hypothetical protein ACYDHY_09495 [Acidiferrobacterales bacterium]